MASLVAGSHLLSDDVKHHVITVAHGEIFIAGDTSALGDDGCGYLRILQRTLCSAEEFHLLVEIPFHFYHTCGSSSCLDWTSSKAVYAADNSNRFIYALAYGNEEISSTPDLLLFKISLTNGTHTTYKLKSFIGDGVWNLCTLCRGTKMRVVEGRDDEEGGEGASSDHDRLIVYDTILHAQSGLLIHNLPTFPPYHRFDECQVMEMSVDEDSKQFLLAMNLFHLPLECHGLDVSICPLNEHCTKWAGISESGTLLIYDSSTGDSERYTPSKRAEELVQKFIQRSIQVAATDDGDVPQLELMTEPDVIGRNGPKCDGRFRFFRLELNHTSRSYRLRLAARSSLFLSSDVLAAFATPWYRSPGETFIYDGVLYKHYGSCALLVLLRMPTLVEASFVALNKHYGATGEGEEKRHEGKVMLYGGVGQRGLNQALGVRTRWFA